MLAAALLLLAAQLAAATAASGGSSSASSAAAWPHSVQPFWLSALNTKLTAADARYLGSLPVVVVNHKQGPGRGKQAEANQLLALSQVKAANASCATFFYLNSQIDFPELQLHEQFVANGRSTLPLLLLPQRRAYRSGRSGGRELVAEDRCRRLRAARP